MEEGEDFSYVKPLLPIYMFILHINTNTLKCISDEKSKCIPSAHTVITQLTTCSVDNILDHDMMCVHVNRQS